MPRLSLVRPISQQEAAILVRMLDHCAAIAELRLDRESLPKLSVVARCDCGCDTVDFQPIDWSKPPAVIADGKGTTEKGDEVGIIVFGTDSSVACLEVYAHGDELARLPVVDSIHPYGGERRAV